MTPLPLTLLQSPLILLVKNESPKGEILLPDLFDPRVGIVHYVDTLKFEVKNLSEVDVVEGVRFVNLVLQRVRRGWGRFVVVKRKLGWREWT